MRNWGLEVERLEDIKQTEETNKRLELVADEISELQELENEFAIAGTELNKYKQTLAEVIARNSPVIEQLTRRLNEMKTAIKEIDIEMYLQSVVINNASLETAKQQTSVNELAARKEESELNFAQYMAAKHDLIELERVRDTEKEKLEDLNDRFYKLRAVPDLANIDRRIQELKIETLNAQNRVSNVELDRRQINSRMTFLRATIAKTQG
jgi:chromosome segregation ATPase